MLSLFLQCNNDNHFCKNFQFDLVPLQKSSNKESSVKALPSSTSEPSQLSLSDSSMPPTPVTPVTPTAPALPATPISPPPVSVVSKSVPNAGSEPAKPSQRYALLLSYICEYYWFCLSHLHLCWPTGFIFSVAFFWFHPPPCHSLGRCFPQPRVHRPSLGSSHLPAGW